jgi:hypothetical protein
MAINPRKIKRKPMAARDLKQSNPRDLRNKALREANKMASEKKSSTTKPRPAADLKQSNPKDLRNKALREANKMASESAKASKAKAPNRALVATGNSKGGVPARVQKVRGNPNLARPPKSIRMGGAGGTGRSVATVKGGVPAVVKETAKTTAKVGLRGLLGAGSAVVGMVTESRPAGSAAERAWERRNTEQRRMKGKVGGMAFSPLPYNAPDSPVGGGPKSRQGNQSPRMKAGPIMPKVSMAGGGVNKPASKSVEAAKEKIKAGRQGQAKKKAGATTGATPAKRRTNLDRMRRRQAERFAISSSGRPL